MSAKPGHRIETGIARGEPFTFSFDGVEVTAYPGESISAAVIAAGATEASEGTELVPRGYFCGMGVCWECAVTIDDGPSARACRTRAEPGMAVRTLQRPPKP